MSAKTTRSAMPTTYVVLNSPAVAQGSPETCGFCRRHDVGRRSLRALRYGVLAALVVSALQAQPNECLDDAILDVSKFAGAGGDYAKPKVEASCEGDEFIIRSNGIPHYEFVQITPNPLTVQENVFRLPRHPKLAKNHEKIPFLGKVGVAVNGISLFGPNEGPVPAVERFGDPIFNSIMDECLGHTANEYHYHALNQPCLTDGVKEGAPSPILAFALDGFPIFGPLGCTDGDCSEVIRYESSWEMTGDPTINAWEAYTYKERAGREYLDECNGHTGPTGNYHYHSTATFPYILGCYSGEVDLPERQRVTGNRQPRRGGPARGKKGGRGRRPGGLANAASSLGATLEDLSRVIDEDKLRAYLRDPENVTFDFASAASALQLNEEVLRHALEHQIPSPTAYKGHRPGCTVTPEGYLLCHPRAVHGLVDQIQGSND